MSIATIILSLALIAANVYFFINKKYLYLFIPCILFLPEYYALEISSTLPLITASRIMFVVFYVYAFLNRRRNISFKNIRLKELPKSYLLLPCYFVLRLISNLVYAPTIRQALNTFLEIVFEQLLLLICFYLLAPTKEEIHTLIKVVVNTAFVFFVIGIFESITSIRPFDVLYTVERNMMNSTFIRLGLMRSTTTLGLPNFYSNMCLYVTPLILYLYEKTMQKRYLVYMVFDILAIIHAGSRSTILFFAFLLLIYFVYSLRSSRRILFIKNSAAIVAALAIIMVVLSLTSPLVKNYYLGTVKGVLNEVGFNFEMEKEDHDGVAGYGENIGYGSGSRLAQFTGMYYTLRTNPVFGLGARSNDRKVIRYYSEDHWHPSNTFDVGFVEIFCNEGFVGFTGYIMLLIWLFLLLLKGRKADNSTAFRTIALLFPAYLLAMLSTINMYPYLFLMALIFYILFDEKNIKIIK